MSVSDIIDICLCLVSVTLVSDISRVRTHPGKRGIYWNLIIRIPGLEYTGILSKVRTGKYWNMSKLLGF